MSAVVLCKSRIDVDVTLSEAGAIILNIAYGYTIEPRANDPLVDLADEALIQFSLAANPGSWMVDVFPFRKSKRVHSQSSLLTST